MDKFAELCWDIRTTVDRMYDEGIEDDATKMYSIWACKAMLYGSVAATVLSNAALARWAWKRLTSRKRK